MICTASDIFRVLAYSDLAYSELCLFRYMQEYSNIFSIIKAYSRILRHYYGIVRLIQAYSAPCVTVAYSKPCETLTRHIQNPAIVRIVYSDISKAYSGIFRTLSDACICRSLAYSESWNIQKHSIIASQRIFRTLSCFSKALYL